ncbi:hypothetical protein BO78DRAFT_34252 [Aspergillus sclerotiicarbonarius CBS 121057]|uniref:Uncharacterized protein n=1 Tax=Aspergillus sclerotiicarbonarius (strain CBS 121057 / IBT 28362) TaxID=1448318 RepID=A0A319F6E4_ASPSB|nr:hypothetical protein BO78DRAFT_34252 [Aspergillus sclerotiicarbonarius CBS 121057]
MFGVAASLPRIFFLYTFCIRVYIYSVPLWLVPLYLVDNACLVKLSLGNKRAVEAVPRVASPSPATGTLYVWGFFVFCGLIDLGSTGA